jgi:hypothetical protein
VAARRAAQAAERGPDWAHSSDVAGIAARALIALQLRDHLSALDFSRLAFPLLGAIGEPSPRTLTVDRWASRARHVFEAATLGLMGLILLAVPVALVAPRVLAPLTSTPQAPPSGAAPTDGTPLSDDAIRDAFVERVAASSAAVDNFLSEMSKMPGASGLPLYERIVDWASAERRWVESNPPRACFGDSHSRYAEAMDSLSGAAAQVADLYRTGTTEGGDAGAIASEITGAFTAVDVALLLARAAECDEAASLPVEGRLLSGWDTHRARDIRLDRLAQPGPSAARSISVKAT